MPLLLFSRQEKTSCFDLCNSMTPTNPHLWIRCTCCPVRPHLILLSPRQDQDCLAPTRRRITVTITPKTELEVVVYSGSPRSNINARGIAGVPSPWNSWIWHLHPQRMNTKVESVLGGLNQNIQPKTLLLSGYLQTIQLERPYKLQMLVRGISMSILYRDTLWRNKHS